jgi:hypothetical protein
VSAFERKMVARLSGSKSEGSSTDGVAALMLEKRTVAVIRVVDPSGQEPYRTARLTSRTRIDDIQLKQLPSATFEPPKGYAKLENQRRHVDPAEPPAASERNVATEWSELPSWSRSSQL